MDKNTLAGFGLLALLLIGYIFYNQKSESQIRQQFVTDSIAAVKSKLIESKVLDSNAVTLNSSATGDSATYMIPEKKTVLENEDVAITFSNKGGHPTKVELKKFKTFDGKPLILLDGEVNTMDFSFKTTNGFMQHSKSMMLTDSVDISSRSIYYTCNDMQIAYTLPEKGYMLQLKAMPLTADKSQAIQLDWNEQSFMTEQDVESQKLYTQVCYNLEKEGYDFYTIQEKETKEFKEPLKWLAFKQHYFSTILLPAPKLVHSAKVSSEIKVDTNTKALSIFQSSLQLNPLHSLDFQLYVGPNNYGVLKSYKQDLQEIIPLSYGIFGFVKYINTWLIIPIFNWLSSLFSSYGVVILLLTFIIRLLMSPFTYKSYVSSAKMKALKPELDELREKMGDDKQAYGVEQMKLYRQAGVNPLGGCLPALLQLPVFFALLSFFPHAIELRQEKFLWAKDLSTYDSIFDLPFTIPFYGNHISLFTILFVITSLILALYSMNMTVQDQNNPMMKYLPFIMPVMFLGIFNKLPAALTYYYFVSNVITLGLQFVIQNYIIDPDKIHAQIQAKKNEPPKENKLMARMAEMQRQQQERMKQNNQPKKK